MDPYYSLYTEPCDDSSYKPLQFFIAQSMPIPETTVLPSGVEVPSYCHSVLKGDMQLIEKARSEKKDINVTFNNTPRCLLHYGVLAEVPKEERYRNLKKLVDLGADREQRDEHGRTPLHLAFLLGDTKAVDVLLEAGCDITANCHGNNLIHLATISGNLDMFHKVQEFGFDPQELTEYGFTTVHLAACYNQHQMIPLLKRYGVDVNQRNEILADVTSPFRQAIMPVGLSYYLLYASKNLRGKACTFVEFMHTHSNLFQSEIFHTNVAESNLIGNPPLVLATCLGFLQSVKALVNNGANPSCVDSNGLSPLDLACTMDHFEVVKYLSDQQESHDESIGQSSILSAAMFGDVDIVEYLVGMSSADFAISEPDSTFPPITLAHIAALMNRPDILQFALTIECKSSTNRPREANYLLVCSILGSLLKDSISKAEPLIAPLFQVTEESKCAVLSAILDMPGCEPMEIVPLINVCAVDIAVMLCQSTTLSVMMDRVKVLNRLVCCPTSAIIDPPIPMLHLCVCSYALLPDLLRTDESDSEELNFLRSFDLSIDDFRNTFDVFLKHGFDINVVSDDLTCLDIAICMEVPMPEVESYLRSHGALTSEQLNTKKQKVELTEKMEELMVENQELKLQNKELSRKMDVILKQLSPLFSFLNPGSNPPTQLVTTPSPSVTSPSPAVILSTLLPAMSVTTISPSVPVMIPPPVPDTTPTDPFLTTPTVNQLNQIIIRQIALDWYSVGLHLEIEVLTLKIIEADVYPPSVEKCCCTMFTKWLSHDEGTGGAPRRWRTVLKALKDAGYTSLVGDVERVLFEQNQ